MAMVEQFDAFFNAAEFAVNATWLTHNIQVIFDHEYAEQFGIAGTNPIVLTPTASVSGIKKNDAFVVNGISYKVHNIEPDGTGLTRLQLTKA
jgi:hypothetical protein